MQLVRRARKQLARIRDEEVLELVLEALAEDDRWRASQSHDGGGFSPDGFEAFFPEHGPDAVAAAWHHYQTIRRTYEGAA